MPHPQTTSVRRLAAIALAAAVPLAAVASCGKEADATAAPKATAAKPFTVRSSLDGLRVLPHRIHWTATTSLPAAQVEKVDFLVDGKLAWSEEQPPYSFDDDGGYLVTSWIAPGRRTLTVRATASNGKTAEDSVTTDVVPAPAPPAALRGTWTRKITDLHGAPAPGSPGNPTETHTPKGTYRLVIDRVQMQMRFPGTFATPASDDTGAGWILDNDATYASHALVAAGGVTKEPFDGSTAEGGWWCENDGPSSAYSWSVRGDELVLRPAAGHDRCGIRGFVWSGTWHRAHG